MSILLIFYISFSVLLVFVLIC